MKHSLGFNRAILVIFQIICLRISIALRNKKMELAIYQDIVDSDGKKWNLSKKTYVRYTFECLATKRAWCVGAGEDTERLHRANIWHN